MIQLSSNQKINITVYWGKMCHLQDFFLIFFLPGERVLVKSMIASRVRSLTLGLSKFNLFIILDFPEKIFYYILEYILDSKRTNIFTPDTLATDTLAT